MAATLFYLDPLPREGERAVLDGPEGRHAATVRRIGVGERLVLADGHGRVADAEVVGAGKDRLELLIGRDRSVTAPTPRVTVVQALPKSERSELSVELATEAGADAIVPWQASRSVSRWEGPKAAKGVGRWRSAALRAAQQSRRPVVPSVDELHTTKGVATLIADAVAGGALVLALHEGASSHLVDLPLTRVPHVVLIVGPEGGLSGDELARFEAAGAATVLLGPQVVRTSTAAALALAAIGSATQRWRATPFGEQPA
ncbi:16S rRNA (uracil(1498)-N(3))-methyltransferase [Rhodococcus rhodnii]|uniref:Ribosomal RNA small subunit methyltransferase E n=2 Tax=Rhodococcus rhodnii TaxID=38312 RepID=R7WM63_9NOCA|nr:16S rRNA (uracil(1498)-N(3))-methyltransferase [Rhodococcus rhodnii]EOM76383.1 16S ribosomal RNA methyltransferase [Rhodococcus rhodnii LMG 5362]TXG91508.1 16S rRNA (uracil(1498)-N(3))-methyltransferase [Rhodococcus rhodnii]